MPKLHEVLAAEKTVAGAWNTMLDETTKKMANAHFFEGHTKSLKMIEDSEGNAAVEAAASDNRVVPTNVHDTLDYALKIFANAENLQASKNFTNAVAKADVMFRGAPILTGLPVDELLGLEARLGKIRGIYVAIPTLDAGKAWTLDPATGNWVAEPEHTVKSEKIMVPVTLAPATDNHPAQVKEASKDNPVGRFTTIKRSGAVTALQKADAIKLIDELLVEIKQARMRANETQVVPNTDVGNVLFNVLMAPFKN